jgi:methyl-accepting chemotaxis protein
MTQLHHPRQRLRLPMFFKLLVGCLTLAALLIVGGSRGNYLAKARRRLDGYVDRVGRGMTGTVELLAADGELRAGVQGTLVPAPGGGGSGASFERVLDTSAGAAHAKEMYESLNGRNGLQPDLYMVYTANNHIIWTPTGSPLKDTDLAVLAPVEKTRSGSVFPHGVVVYQGAAYQMSAAPILAPNGDKVVGGMLMGELLEHYYSEWAEQSDDLPEQRMQPTLIKGIDILASSWPPEERAELSRALQPDKYAQVKVGDDVQQVVRMKSGDFDFWGDDLEGYKNGEPGVVGKLYIMRSRTLLQDPQTIPWAEVLGGIGGSILIALGMAFWITRPIKQFVGQSRGLLTGATDLTQRIEVDSRDETADLAENINQVFSRLHGLATGVQSAAFQVGASSAEISAASKQMLSGLKDQTLKIESSTTAVTELSASIQQVAGNAAQATQVAEASSTAVNSAVHRMEEIRAAVDDAAGKMRDLGESSKRIGNIVEVIRQISEQTSMLALNASIEAAHAGEQGRGFAVVADEVSSLARRVGQSAKDIEALIQTVKEQTQAAVASMEVGTREVVNGSALVTGTLTGLGELISVVKETANAVQEQAVVSDEIARNMDAVRQIAGDVLSGSEESVVQAERLHELAFELEESIGGFNLDGNQVGGTKGAAAARKAAQASAQAASLVAKAKRKRRALPGAGAAAAAGAAGAAGASDDDSPEDAS